MSCQQNAVPYHNTKHCWDILWKKWQVQILGTGIINQNFMHKEIKSTIHSKNAGYNSVTNVLSSRLLCEDVLKRLKCTLVQALRLCTGHTVHRGSRGIALPFLTTALEGGEGSASRPGRFLPPEKNRYPLYRRLGGPQGRTGAVNLAPTGIRPLDRPGRSQSLYRLR
jgi:hypothetical protein